MVKLSFTVAFALSLFLCVFLLSREVSICQTAVPEAWRKIDAEGLFTFDLPPGMKQTDMAGVESFLREYLDGKKRFLFVHEPYSYLAYDERRSEEMKDYHETETKISSRRANIRTYYSVENGHKTYVAELHVGDWDKGQVEVFMSLEGNCSTDLETAKQIFNTVEFSKGKGTHNPPVVKPFRRALFRYSTSL
ncbi:MAG: hypothetical protein ACRD8U_13035 [Pyrinomonadaceae bacterium]